MDWNYFWLYLDELKALGVEGFGLFSKDHFIWLGAILIGTIIYTAGYKKCGEKGRDNMRKFMAIFLLFIEIFKQCVNAFRGIPDGIYLPLEICSLAEYTILFDAFWPDKKPFKDLMAFAFLPAAFMALVMPTASVYPAISFYAFHQLLMHAGIIAYIVARYVAGEIKPRYIGIWVAVLLINIAIIPVYYINSVMGQNYMFLIKPDGNPVFEVVWNIFGGNGGLLYVLGLEVLVIIVMHIMYGIYRLLGIRKSH